MSPPGLDSVSALAALEVHDELLTVALALPLSSSCSQRPSLLLEHTGAICPFLGLIPVFPSALNLVPDFVHSGCSNKNTLDWAGWLINNRNLFLTVLVAGKSKIKVLADSASGEDPLPGSFWVFP